ncbi:uncharacterized protein B0I36DRAFT_387373 [Microdochium trichocladiopsis]|uniref:DUF7587 domain-containing protein n=1 Tax=Microdochium trichocladiopsis TaxID=1682393 RepID=A0A9P8Y0G4_9PEZI|nr:uncharacterized protein B0I36DRAFT_387373 [Microdochium trichocladiopsis]KAH7024973.1 hypothetical protein B0I36DRAFT_387373 [Microdochium trichocladiopsis]
MFIPRNVVSSQDDLVAHTPPESVGVDLDSAFENLALDAGGINEEGNNEAEIGEENEDNDGEAEDDTSSDDDGNSSADDSDSTISTPDLHSAAESQRLTDLLGLPTTLWRVQHRWSQSRLDQATNDYLAAAQRPISSNVVHDRDLRAAVERHVVWSDWSARSCFLSTMSCEMHMRNWVTKTGVRDPVLLKIDVETLLRAVEPRFREGAVLDMEWLKEEWGLDYGYARDEYLIVNRIPREAIVSK